MQIAYKSFYRIFERFAYVKVPLDAGDFGLLDRRVIDTLNHLPETHRFMRGLRAWAGYKSIGVPYVRPERMFGVTTNNFRRNLGWARRAIVSFSYAPLDAITLVALITTSFAFLGALVQVVLRIVSPDSAPKGVSTVIVLVLFMGGIQLLCLSIVGSYLAHIYEEVKARPPYVVDEIVNLPAPREPTVEDVPEEELAASVATAAAGTAERRPLDEPDPPLTR
jgi:dolichol-phosphate mannosyltransferase